MKVGTLVKEIKQLCLENEIPGKNKYKGIEYGIEKIATKKEWFTV